MIQLSYSITPDRKYLSIFADADARAELREGKAEEPEWFGSDDALHEAFEHLICNSELDWIRPEECGDLTDAPILGVVEYDGDAANDEGEPNMGNHIVVERWGFMDYALRSPLSDLLEKGEAVFTAP